MAGPGGPGYRAAMQETSISRGTAGSLSAALLVLVLAYLYGAVAYLVSDAAYFPEQSPPGWSWPAVLVTMFGFVPAAVLLLFAWGAWRSPRVRADAFTRRLVAVAGAAAVLMLLVMATPPGWELFDWYVS
ncbi:hypothetical protein GCM10009661_79910 [Catellatospora chokoriensis]|uniref:Uncharacterized protein n=2 Tax=Catellatospora chokoriensis TaxID=310353 RepID=A0A8J3JW87_9ACTN|nr:hypothetical protein Cch02nite_14720 [Catellatospora chokoriensis]